MQREYFELTYLYLCNLDLLLSTRKINRRIPRTINKIKKIAAAAAAAAAAKKTTMTTTKSFLVFIASAIMTVFATSSCVVLFMVVAASNIRTCTASAATTSSSSPKDDGSVVYGTQCSFAITGPTLDGCDSTLLDQRQSFYDEYMEGCFNRYGKHNCMAEEKTRQEMNQRQPQSMVNMTATGYRKIKAPPSLLKLLTEFWEANKDEKAIEEWGTGSIYTVSDCSD